MLNAERQQTERMIQRLAEDVANKTGHEFFRSIVSSLAEVLEADIALVAEVLPPDQQRMRSLARWVDGKEGPNFEEDLAGTPCANVISGGACSYPSNVQEQFPQDAALAQAGAQAFFGTPLISSAGKSLGFSGRAVSPSGGAMCLWWRPAWLRLPPGPLRRWSACKTKNPCGAVKSVTGPLSRMPRRASGGWNSSLPCRRLCPRTKCSSASWTTAI